MDRCLLRAVGVTIVSPFMISFVEHEAVESWADVASPARAESVCTYTLRLMIAVM